MERFLNKIVFNKETGEVGFCWYVSNNPDLGNYNIQIIETVLHDSNFNGSLVVKEKDLVDWTVFTDVNEIQEYPSAHINYAIYLDMQITKRLNSANLNI